MWRWIFFVILLILSGLYPFSIFYSYNVYFGVLIGFYFILQIGFATKNYCSLRKINGTPRPNFPSVSILITGYRENPVYWENCLLSLKKSNYPNIKSISAFIDGNEEEDRYMEVIFKTIFPYNHCFLFPKKGKRNVMYQGFLFIKSVFPTNEYIIVVDSDTILENDGIHFLVNCIDQNPKIGCATGNIRIFNRHEGILAKIIASRYGYAFNIERSAMSAVGVMNCCSGPFSIYRQSYLSSDILDQFLNQRFCGKEVGPGDDRHLTLLLLTQGHLSKQTPFAMASTETPISLDRYLQQQLRWMRSFYREMIWQLRAIGNQNPYLSVITVYEFFFPFFILLSFLPTFGFLHKSLHQWQLLFQRFTIAFGILVLRTLLLCIFNHKENISTNAYNILVFPLYFSFLMPLKIYALFTCPVQSWITSPRNNMFKSLNLDRIGIYTSIFIWWAILGLLFTNLFYSLKNIPSQ